MNPLELSEASNLSYDKRHVYKLALNAALGAVFFGYAMAVFNPL